jgi:hypothetical protein
LAFRADLQQLLYAFGPDAVTFSTAIPYSWQVSQIRTGRRSINPKGDEMNILSSDDRR